MDFFNRFLGRNAPGATARPGWPPAPQPQYPAAWSAPKVKPSISPTVGLRGAGIVLGPLSVGLDLYATGRQVFNPQDNIITRLGALGNSIENVIGSGGGVPKASKPSQKRPDGYSSYGTYTVGGIEYDINSGRPTYMPPGSVYSSSSVAPFSPAAERDYQQKKSQIAQLTAQDPELKRYEEASKKAKTQEEMDAARDIGMAIWARTHGPGSKNNLAAKVKPGQSGYETIQKTLYPGGAPLPTMSAESEAMLNAIAPPDATGVRPNVTPMPGQPPVLGGPSEAMFQAVTGGGSYITPMPQEAATPQTQAQDLAEAYRQAMLARILTNK